MPTDVPTLHTESVVSREDMDVATLHAESVVRRVAGTDVTTLMVEVVVDDREFRKSGMLAAVETDSLDENRKSGMLATVETDGLDENRKSGMLATVETDSLDENRLSGMLMVVEYIPFTFTPMSDRENTGRELSGESKINDRRFTGQRRKKRRGY